ncbi:FAD-dependent oxidoreductase [Sphingomonas sp.]|uniref:FAD-dependent oxidoreductase n=1 Tax=Sphingomonas sp. TaxID=28214 RepID=UPI002DD68521|nr:FAD-dependent oxidoreductase [Sphingomonas sp.]
MSETKGDADIVIAGGGPAGMMAGLLFARAGLKTVVLEKHGDFLRDFRGDTVHPSTLALIDQLGLLNAFLALPHDRVNRISAMIEGREWRIADFARLPLPANFVAMMPQWHFLDFLAGTAGRYPRFDLRMSCEATGLIVEGDRVAGLRTPSGEIRARLTILADGRGSRLRGEGGLPLRDLGAPIDVLWFRVPAAPAAANRTGGYIAGGEMIVAIDRGDYLQCARVIAKGGADAIRTRGIAAFRADVVRVVPMLGPSIGAVAGWDEVKLLSVSLDRLERWHRPGLLAIGDAAHAMSPVGGVGINLAIQDAVAAANILAAPMMAGADPDPLLARVQARRMMPVRVIQAMQAAVHRNILSPTLAGRTVAAPLPVRLLDRSAALRAIPARVLGLGLRRERILSPEA